MASVQENLKQGGDSSSGVRDRRIGVVILLRLSGNFHANTQFFNKIIQVVTNDDQP